jgi:hypothetical protein
MTQIEKNTKIIKAIESITGRFISAIHDEAKGYAFKIKEGWMRLDYAFVNEIAGFGSVNECLID